MADWNLPTTTSGYLDFVSQMNAKFVDAATLQFGGPVNLPVNTIRFNRSINIFEEWDAATWVPKVIGLVGGGTGANNAGQARINLGIGSMGTQNSNAVNITGGSITGVGYSGSDIVSGIVALARGGTGQSLSISPYGTVMMSDGAKLLLYSGAAIAELNASALVVGTVPAARLPGVAFLAGNNIFSAANTFTSEDSSTSLVLKANQPAFNIYSLGQADVDKQNIRLFNFLGDIRFQKVNGAYTAAWDIFSITNDGIVTCHGGGITNLNAVNITTGIVATARLGSGVANSQSFLRGDGQWAIPSLTPVDPIPSGLIAMFSTNCPAGWTRVAALDGRFPMGSAGFGATGGASTHHHSFGANTSNAGAHSHHFSGNGSGNGNATGTIVGATGAPSGGINVADAGSSFNTNNQAHTHNIGIPVDLPVSVSVTVSGNTDPLADHNHNVNGNTSDENVIPPYLTVVYCQKN